jgi:hypothetical protein
MRKVHTIQRLTGWTFPFHSAGGNKKNMKPRLLQHIQWLHHGLNGDGSRLIRLSNSSTSNALGTDGSSMKHLCSEWLHLHRLHHHEVGGKEKQRKLLPNHHPM